MRIFYFECGPIPSRKSSSLHVVKMGQALAQNGHDVTVLTPDWPEHEEDARDPFAFHGVDRCLALRKVPRLEGGWRRRLSMGC